jgi:heme exporter protein CcmD
MEIFAMGEYGSFVWTSYLLTLAVVVVSTIQGRRRHQQVAHTITQRLKIEETDE